MRLASRVVCLGAVSIASVLGCGGSSTVVGGDTGVVVDVGQDTGPVDTGPADTGPADSGPADTGPADTGLLDTGLVDTGVMDVVTDTGPEDTGPVDAGPPDTGPTDTGPRCPPNQSLCTSGCADLQADPANCGTCATACAPAERCVSGACTLVCATGQTVCAGRCVDLQTDPTHCGSCGSGCPTGRACSAGVCVALCVGNQSVCDGGCRDTQTDRQHCGMCGRACASGEVCTVGACVASCTAGLSVCGANCRDLQNDRANCGMCGTQCPDRTNATAACVSATCRSFCNDGFGDCDSNATNGCETNTRTTLDHCGGCNVRCEATKGTAACTDGRCVVTACATGRGNCDGNASNGCEVDVTNSNAHCGACGNACTNASRCVSGRCEVVGVSCNAIHTADANLQSGTYLLDPDGDGPGEAFRAYCDMTSEGGGWTYLATITNSGDAANQGNWLVGSPVPNNWESTSATFGGLDPSLNQDARSVAFHRVRGREVMITHRNLFLLRTDNQCLGDATLRDRFAGLGWECGGSANFTTFPTCTHPCVISRSTPRTGDTAMLNGVMRTRLFLKAGEADGAQDTNRDRAYFSTEYRDNVDYPTGLGAFCSGSSCTPRTGDADVNDRSDAITPTAGSEYYGVWVR